MQTVNFLCGHCGKLMAVGSDYLGQQVRCPHCQQVVLAPSVPPAPIPPAPVFMDPNITFNRGEHDSIFGPTEQTDDLFDAAPSRRLAMPPPPTFLPPEP